MQLSRTELKVLVQITKGNYIISDIAKALSISTKQVYRISQKLTSLNIITNIRGHLTPNKLVHVTLLLQLLAEYPSAVDILPDSGMKILMCLIEPKLIEDIIKETNLKKSIVYKKLKQSYERSIIKKKARKYVINEQIWSKLKEVLHEIDKYESTIDNRVPTGSIIYYKQGEEIVFSNKNTLGATLTAFSAYASHGIKIFPTTNYYYLPMKKLKKKEIFLHSLNIIEKEKNIRLITFATLFFLKHKKSIGKIENKMLSNIKLVLADKKIEGYPTLNEIKNKAEIYDIKI